MPCPLLSPPSGSSLGPGTQVRRGRSRRLSTYSVNEQMDEEMNIRFIHILILTILIEK